MYFLNGECISDEKVKKIILSISWQLKFFNPQSDEFLSWVGSLEAPPFPGIQWMQKERKKLSSANVENPREGRVLLR